MELSLGEMVCGRPDQPFLQLPGPPCSHLAAQQSGPDLGGRTGRSADAHLPATAHRGIQIRERFEIPGRPERRTGRHLHGHVPRAAHRHAGVHAHRRAAHDRLWRLFVECPSRSHHGFAGIPGDHAGRLLPARRRGEIEARRGRGAALLPVRPQRGGLPADRNAADHAGRARSLVARSDGPRVRRLPRRTAGRRASAVSAVHIGHHRKA